MSARRVAAVVLAAGSSSRMGSLKQLIEVGGQSLVRRTVQTVGASEAGIVVVTTAPDGVDFNTELSGLEWMRAEVERPQEGQSESIRAGLKAVKSLGNFDAILFCPCDLPLLSASHLNALIGQFQHGNWNIVASRYNQIFGAPMIVGREVWPDLALLRGDTGARKILPAHQQSTTFIEWANGAFDLDTPADMEAWLRLSSDSGSRTTNARG